MTAKRSARRRRPAHRGRLLVGILSLSLSLSLFLATTACSERSALPNTWTEPWSGLEMVLIPAGPFVMGSPPSEVGREAQEVEHEVEISQPFYLGRYEVTQGQWRQVMGADPSHFAGCGDDCPVEQVNYLDIERFFAKLNARTGHSFRLPSEAEWEVACRAGTRSAFATGDEITLAQANYDADDESTSAEASREVGRTTPAGSYPANPWGLHDMHGNVWEWTRDDHCPYRQQPLIDPIGKCDTNLKVIRGGSWHFGADSMRCALRYTHRPQDDGPSLGFRVVREL